MTSFVHPRWVPQLADAEQLLRAGLVGDGARRGAGYRCSCPTFAVWSGRSPAACDEVAVFVGATESFAQQEPEPHRPEALDMSARSAVTPSRRLSRCAATCRCASATRGRATSTRPVVDVVRTLREQGCDEISLGDTIGVGHGRPGRRRCSRPSATPGWPRTALAVHFHDTYGQALANTLVALQRGITVVDASAGGLGGCPFAQSRHGQPRHRGPRLDAARPRHRDRRRPAALVETSVWLSGQMGRPSPSRSAPWADRPGVRPQRRSRWGRTDDGVAYGGVPGRPAARAAAASSPVAPSVTIAAARVQTRHDRDDHGCRRRCRSR